LRYYLSNIKNQKYNGMKKRRVYERPVKISNVLLLVIFLMVGLFFCSFVASVDHKLSHGDFTYSNSDKSMYTRHKFGTRKVVVIRNLSSCAVIPSDSVSFEVFNGDSDRFQYSVNNDTVTINQTASASNRVLVYLPSESTLNAISSVVSMKGSFDYNNPTSYDVVLRDSELAVSAGDAHTFFEHLKVDGLGRSHLVVGDYTHIKNLHVGDIAEVKLSQGWQVGRLTSSFRTGTEMTKLGDSVSIATK
jgi:hypothetical protein